MEKISNLKKILNTNIIGKNIFWFDKINSTNDIAKQSIDKYNSNGNVFIADMQTNGKGRLNRNWVSLSEDGLYLSILLKPNIPIDEFFKLTLISSLAVCNTVNKYLPNRSYIKWPNDIIVKNKKLSGILLESTYKFSSNYAIVGIGLNVNQHCFDKEIKNKATSMFLESSKTFNKLLLIKDLLENFESSYIKYIIEGKDLINDYKSNCININKKVSFTRNLKEISGKVIDISNKGELIIKTDTLETFTVNSGEVVIQDIY